MFLNTYISKINIYFIITSGLHCLLRQKQVPQNNNQKQIDLNPNLLTLILFLKEFFEKVNFAKRLLEDNKSMKNYPECKELKRFIVSIWLEVAVCIQGLQKNH